MTLIFSGCFLILTGASVLYMFSIMEKDDNVMLWWLAPLLLAFAGSLYLAVICFYDWYFVK